MSSNPDHFDVQKAGMPYGELPDKLEHDAEKWTPVFGKTSCENKKLARRFEFTKTHHALATAAPASRSDDPINLTMEPAAGLLSSDEVAAIAQASGSCNFGRTSRRQRAGRTRLPQQPVSDGCNPSAAGRRSSETDYATDHLQKSIGLK